MLQNLGICSLPVDGNGESAIVVSVVRVGSAMVIHVALAGKYKQMLVIGCSIPRDEGLSGRGRVAQTSLDDSPPRTGPVI